MDGALDDESACLSAEQTSGEQLSVEGERRDLARRVGRIGGDAGRTVTCALAAGALFGGRFAVGRVGEAQQRARVGDEALLAGRHVEDPQRVDGVVAGAAAEEDDARAVG